MSWPRGASKVSVSEPSLTLYRPSCSSSTVATLLEEGEHVVPLDVVAGRVLEDLLDGGPVVAVEVGTLCHVTLLGSSVPLAVTLAPSRPPNLRPGGPRARVGVGATLTRSDRPSEGGTVAPQGASHSTAAPSSDGRLPVRLGITTPVLTLLPGGHAAWEVDAGIDEVATVARAPRRSGTTT